MSLRGWVTEEDELIDRWAPMGGRRRSRSAAIPIPATRPRISASTAAASRIGRRPLTRAPRPFIGKRYVTYGGPALATEGWSTPWSRPGDKGIDLLPSGHASISSATRRRSTGRKERRRSSSPSSRAWAFRPMTVWLEATTNSSAIAGIISLLPAGYERPGRISRKSRTRRRRQWSATSRTNSSPRPISRRR